MNAVEIAPGRALLQQVSLSLSAVFDAVSPSLVQVRRGGRGLGAGTIVGPGGLLLTSAHVVETRGRVSSTLEAGLSGGRSMDARIVAIDRRHDLALLETGAGHLPALELGDSAALAPGALVLAFGFPYGVDFGATVGSVIGTGAAWAPGEQRVGEWLAAALHLRPGHSGGPMVDTQGRLMGVNAMMSGPDVGVAVPAHIVRTFLADAQAGTRRRHAPDGVTWV